MSATPGTLLDTARDLLSRASPETAGLWPRAAALLARQALEMALRDYWGEARADMSRLPYRQQLICLQRLLTPREVAAETGHAWAALSRSCHHHPYELAPGAQELSGLFEIVERFVGVVQAEGHSS
jgi:hypothetical protein